MTKGLHRYYGAHDLHFITCSCYHRQPQLGTAQRRDLFLTILEESRQKYRFVVHGYVIMPEHFHLLMTEPEEGDPSVGPFKATLKAKARAADRSVRPTLTAFRGRSRLRTTSWGYEWLWLMCFSALVGLTAERAD